MDISVAAKRRAEALERTLEILDLDIAIPTTKAPAVEQQMFVAQILEAIAERLPKPRAKKKQ